MLASLVGLSCMAGDFADAQTCFTLQAELLHLQGRSGGGSRDRARYERAYREQINVIARTEARARRAACFGGGFFFFRDPPQPICNTLVPRLRDMQNNLARLDRLRRRGGVDNSDRIRRVQGRMAALGCGLPGRDAYYGPEDEWSMREAYSMPGGTYRTLCVRTCDGYYFPISYSTTPEQFGQDAQTCAQMCPGAEAKLYYHHNPGGGPEDMTSLEGGNYTSLPTAFLYRTTVNPSCSCKPPGGFAGTTAMNEPPFDPTAMEDSTAPVPKPRPSPGEDPETLANRAGYFVPGLVAKSSGALAGPVTSGGRPVRVVGPAFGETPEQEGVIIAPVPN